MNQLLADVLDGKLSGRLKDVLLLLADNNNT